MAGLTLCRLRLLAEREEMAMADIDFDAYIPAHVQDNYRELVAERHGDWLRLARELEATGDETLAKWAASQADDKPDKTEKAVDKAPRTTRGAKAAG